VDKTRLDKAIEKARQKLLALQRSDGHWCGRFQAGVLYDSWFVILKAILGKLDDSRIPLCAQYILSQQEEDGGWSTYLGGKSDIKVSVDAYFALKLAGLDHDLEPMVRARSAILKMAELKRR